MNFPAGHTLESYDEDFLTDGIVAVCQCGWKTPTVANLADALTMFLLHVHDIRAKEAEGGAQ